MSLEIIDDKQLIHSQPTVIKVIGVGGGGCNAVNRMIDSGMRGVDFIAVNTDLQSLSTSRAKNKIQIGQKITKGLGAGSHPDVGFDSAEEQKELLMGELKGSNMVFVTAGMGGGTGTGAAPVVARIAKELGALTVAVVTKPFKFERPMRMQYAEKGIAELEKVVDTIIVVPNENLLSLNEDLSINQAYEVADSVLMNGVKGISDLVVNAGLLNVDFADVETVMKDQGSAVMCSATVDSKLPVDDILQELTNNPLVEQGSIDGAKGLLINVVHGNDTPMLATSKIINAISEKADPNSLCISGFMPDDSLGRDLKITLIATGFNEVEERNSNEKRGIHPVINPVESTSSLKEKIAYPIPSSIESDEGLMTDISDTNGDVGKDIDSDDDPLSWRGMGQNKEMDNEKDLLMKGLFGEPSLIGSEEETKVEPVEEQIYTLAVDEPGIKKKGKVSPNVFPRKASQPEEETQIKFAIPDNIKKTDLSVPTYIRSQKKIQL